MSTTVSSMQMGWLLGRRTGVACCCPEPSKQPFSVSCRYACCSCLEMQHGARRHLLYMQPFQIHIVITGVLYLP